MHVSQPTDAIALPDERRVEIAGLDVNPLGGVCPSQPHLDGEDGEHEGQEAEDGEQDIVSLETWKQTPAIS